MREKRMLISILGIAASSLALGYVIAQPLPYTVKGEMSLLSEPYDMNITLTIIDPDRSDETRPEVEFYEGYGILFEHDARGDGPICIERDMLVQVRDEQVNERRCIAFDDLKTIIWSTPTR